MMHLGHHNILCSTRVETATVPRGQRTVTGVTLRSIGPLTGSGTRRPIPEGAASQRRRPAGLRRTSIGFQEERRLGRSASPTTPARCSAISRLRPLRVMSLLALLGRRGIETDVIRIEKLAGPV